jgi:hypothetical protein
MMRYRRNRATTMEPNGASGQTLLQQQQAVQGGQGQNPQAFNKMWTGEMNNNNGANLAPNGANWAVYQNNNKMPQQQQQLQQQQSQHPSLRKSGTASSAGTNGVPVAGWPQQGYANDRPKSAGISSTASGANNNNGLIASLTGAGRPSSSNNTMSATNWNNPNNGNANPNAVGINTANTNTLSYGSLKNRFLTGATKPVSNVPTNLNNNNNGGAVSAGSSKSSKLFTLAR